MNAQETIGWAFAAALIMAHAASAQPLPAAPDRARPLLLRVAADEQEDTRIYKVVLNHEEQYSIWPADRENALGWRDAGKVGTRQECLDYIKDVWTDMRPQSLRKAMEEQQRKDTDAQQPQS